MKIFSKKAKLSKIKKSLKTKNLPKENTIKDSRFDSVHYDPKFLPASKKISKTEIDDRFSGLFQDKRFKIVSEKDKYGRDIEIEEENEEMNKLYYMQQENPEQNQKNHEKIKKNKAQKKISEKNEKKQENTNEQKPSKKKEVDKNKKKNKKEKDDIYDKYYNEQGKFEWNQESSSEDESENQLDLNDDVWQDDEEKVIRNESSSSKLALLNYDWMHIHAEDLMILFNSLKPKEGIIKKVVVYPSEFGLKRMEKENLEGPTDVWQGAETTTNEDKTKHDKKKDKSKVVEKEINEWIANTNKPTEFDPIKLRKYEKDRLKYYYAVIECDSKQTAEHIYSECDGTEFEMSGMKIDLRFVPEDTQFPFEPKDSCDYIPISGKVNNFINRATNHTNVELTWENPDMNRFDYLYNKNMTEEDWDKIDYSKIIGDPNESIASISEGHAQDFEINNEKNDNEEENIDWRADFDKKNKKKSGDIEIKFASGFNDLGNVILEKKKEKEESTWEKYLRTKKEKKKARKLLEKNKMKEEDYFIEPKSEKKDLQKYEDELGLLVEVNERKTKNMNVDVSDERFKAIFEDSRYGIDPTHKDFSIEGSGKYLKEEVDRRKKNKKNF